LGVVEEAASLVVEEGEAGGIGEQRELVMLLL